MICFTTQRLFYPRKALYESGISPWVEENVSEENSRFRSTLNTPLDFQLLLPLPLSSFPLWPMGLKKGGNSVSFTHFPPQFRGNFIPSTQRNVFHGENPLPDAGNGENPKVPFGKVAEAPHGEPKCPQSMIRTVWLTPDDFSVSNTDLSLSVALGIPGRRRIICTGTGHGALAEYFLLDKNRWEIM